MFSDKNTRDFRKKQKARVFRKNTRVFRKKKHKKHVYLEKKHVKKDQKWRKRGPKLINEPKWPKFQNIPPPENSQKIINVQNFRIC